MKMKKYRKQHKEKIAYLSQNYYHHFLIHDGEYQNGTNECLIIKKKKKCLP